MDLLDDSWFPQEGVTEVGEQVVGGAIKPECSEVGYHDQGKMESLEWEVDNLRHCVENLLCELRRREKVVLS